MLSEYVEILNRISSIKDMYAFVTERFKEDPDYAVLLAEEIYGFKIDEDVNTFTAANVNRDFPTRLLLANLIAERAVLAKMGSYMHLTVSIVGMAGSGKTTYSVASAIGAYMILGHTRDEATKLAEENIFFDPKQFVDTVRERIRERIWTPVMIFDDVGAQISKYWHWIGQKYWIHLFSLLDQVKEFIGVLVLTARNFHSIPARLRELSDLIAEARIGTVGSRGPVLNILQFYRYDDYLSTRRRRENLLFIDVMLPSIRMPQSIWEKMIEVRKETAEKRLRKLRKEMREKEK